METSSRIRTTAYHIRKFQIKGTTFFSNGITWAFSKSPKIMHELCCCYFTYESKFTINKLLIVYSVHFMI